MNKIILGFIASIFLASSLIAQESKTEEMFAAEFSLNWSPTFKEALKKSKKEKKPVLIYFTGSDWCGPCKALAPILEILSQEYEGKIDIYKIDTEAEQELAAAFGIRSIPSMLFCPAEGQPEMANGALPKAELERIIADVLKVTK